VLAQISSDFDAHCTACDNNVLRGDGRRHFFLLYSEKQSAHLVLSLKLNHEESGRVKVQRRIWLITIGGEEETVDESDERLEDFWQESQFRALLNNSEDHDLGEELLPFFEDDDFRSIALREYATVLIEDGRVAEALELMDRSLVENPAQPQLLRKAGELHATYGNDSRATELYIEAWEQADDMQALAAATLTSYRAGRYGTTEIAAAQLIKHENYGVLGAKALAATGTASRISQWKYSWDKLNELASEVGDRVSAHVARFWSNSLELPIPDWDMGLSVDEYREAIAEELLEEDFDIEENPPALTWGEAQLSCDLVATDPFGARYVFFLTDSMPTAAVKRTLIARARALLLDPEFSGARGILLTRQVFPYAIYRYFTDLPDAQLDLEVDADTTLDVHNENVATWLWAAEKYFGSMVDYSLESLQDIDRILMRFHDDGFGAIEHPLVCLLSSYFREVLQRHVGTCEWTDGKAPMDPRMLALPDGGHANVLSRIRRMVRDGEEFSLHQLAVSLIELVRGPEDIGQLS
jgi:hypothetical protein